MSNFTFDGIASHEFSLLIAHLGSAGATETDTAADIEITSDRSGSKIESYYYGARLADKLEFDLEIYNKHGKTYSQNEQRAIQEWLFGRAEPKFLNILDPDKGNEGYYCWLTKPRKVTIASKVMGWRFTVVSVFPYSVSNIVEQKYKCTADVTTINFYNLGDVDDYLYPEMDIQLLGNTTFLRLQNHNDSDRVFELLALRPGSLIHVNNDHMYMSEASGQDVFQNFNLNWFRLSPGFNKILVTGQCEITFRNRWKKSVGGYYSS